MARRPQIDAGLIIAVDVGTGELGQARAVIDIAARDRGRLGVRVCLRWGAGSASAPAVLRRAPAAGLPSRSSRSSRRARPCRSAPTVPSRRRRPTGRRCARSKLILHGLRKPNAQISGRTPQFRRTDCRPECDRSCRSRRGRRRSARMLESKSEQSWPVILTSGGDGPAPSPVEI